MLPPACKTPEAVRLQLVGYNTPMQRNHWVTEVMRVDIDGPPDVEGKQSQPFFCPGLAPGLSLLHLLLAPTPPQAPN